jgi:hypothetical protein
MDFAGEDRIYIGVTSLQYYTTPGGYSFCMVKSGSFTEQVCNMLHTLLFDIIRDEQFFRAILTTVHYMDMSYSKHNAAADSRQYEFEC